MRIENINLPETISELRIFINSGNHDILTQWAAISAIEAKPDLILDAYTRIERLVQAAKSCMENVEPYQRYRILRDILGKEMQYYSSIEDDRICLLHHVLSTCKGNCLSLCALYVIICQKLDMHSHINLCPNHTFITFQVNKREYAIEATTGPIMPKQVKIRRLCLYDSDALKCLSFFRPLTNLEILATFLTKYTAFLTNRKQYRQAYHAAKLAADIFPSNPDAQYNLALIAATIGYNVVAANAIMRASQLYPPAIKANLVQ